MAKPISPGDQEDPEDPATEDLADAPDGRTVPYWRHVQRLGEIRATSPKASASALPDHNDALDPDMEQQWPGAGEELGSPTTADPVSDKTDEEDPLEPVLLPGAVTTVWSNILSTAFRRLQEGR
ncbi:hypothetical protein ACFQ7A_22365 [Streptomyces sp. NPDC056528]|uniref:hypothetical protein n=1 Tax=Streptomyces sp. NPDC056528 TaxID=3345854 RepID=UPI00367EE010